MTERGEIDYDPAVVFEKFEMRTQRFFRIGAAAAFVAANAILPQHRDSLWAVAFAAFAVWSFFWGREKAKTRPDLEWAFWAIPGALLIAAGLSAASAGVPVGALMAPLSVVLSAASGYFAYRCLSGRTPYSCSTNLEGGIVGIYGVGFFLWYASKVLGS